MRTIKSLIRFNIFFCLLVFLPYFLKAQTQPTITVGGAVTYTYNGISQGNFTSTVVGSVATVTYTYTGTGAKTLGFGPTTTKPTNAGRYQVVASVSADIPNNTLTASSAPLTFNILQAVSTITLIDSSNGSYNFNGNPQGPDSLITTGSSGAKVIYYRGVNSTVYASSTIKPSAVGNYYANADLNADNNYLNSSSNSLLFTIWGNSSVAITGATNYIYIGTVTGPNTSVKTGSTQTVTYTYSGTGSTTYTSTTTPPTNVGTYQVIGSLIKDAIYNAATSAPFVFTISQAPSAITITGSNVYSYNGLTQGPSTKTSSGSTGLVRFTYSGTGTTTYTPSTTKPTKIGTYKVIATMAADANYLGSTSSSFAFTIIQGTSAISVTGYNVYTYNGTAQGPSTKTSSGSSGLVTFTYSGTGTTTYTNTTTKPTNVGTYKAMATIAADSNYLGATSTTYNFTIYKAFPTFQYNDIGFKTIFYYNGLPQGPSNITVVGYSGKISYLYGSATIGDNLKSTTKPTNVGFYNIYSSLEDTSNFIGNTDVFPFTIWPNNTSITITGDTLYTYDGKEKGKITISIKGSTSTPTFNYSGVGSTIYGPSTSKPINVGSYQLIVKVPSDVNNQSANSSAFKFRIQEALLIDTTIKDTSIKKPPVLDTLIIVPVIKDTTIITPVIMDTTIKDSSKTIINENKSVSIQIIGSNSYQYNGIKQGPSNYAITGTNAIPLFSYSGTGETIYGPTDILPQNAGTYQVIVKVPIDSTSDSVVSETYKFEISKVVLTITAQNIEKCFHVPNPKFNYKIEGYISGDDSTAFSTLPTVFTIATIDSSAGVYKLNLSEASAFNYSFNYVDGILTIHPLPVATIQSAVNYVCDGSTLLLKTTEGYSYIWYKNKVEIENAVDSLLFVNAYGDYSCKLSSVFGCEAMATNVLSVMQYYKPTPNFSIINSCINLPVIMSNESEVSNSGPVQYFWNSGAGENSLVQNPKFVYSNTGGQNITLTINPNFCPALQSTISKTVFIEAPIPAIKMPTADAVLFMPLLIQARNFGVKYSWTATKTSTLGNAAIVFDSTSAQAKLIANTEALLNVKITAANGCLTIDSMQVRIFKYNNVYLPNSFSPNGDGINDVFKINPVGIASLYYFKIYDSWGGLIFETNNLSQGWDGKLNGVRQPMASYTWSIQAIDVYNNVVKEMGSVTLIR